MHGLMEIRKMNRNPKAYAKSQESDGQEARTADTKGAQKPGRDSGDKKSDD